MTVIDLEVLSDDPYPVLAEQRRREPVSWAPALGRWLVTSRALAIDVLMDTDTFTTASDSSPIRSTFGPQMLSTDGDEQRRHRVPFAPSFRRGVVTAGFAHVIAERCEGLAAELTGGRADLAPLAGKLAVLTIVDVLGLDVDDPVLVRAWYDDLAAALANVVRDPGVAERGVATATSVRSELERARLVEEAASRIGTDAAGANALLILFGGIETTESMILNAVWALWSHPGGLQQVRDDPSLRSNAVEESLRWEPAVQTLTRFATRDVTLHDARVARGDVVEVMIGGANRDPSHFADPDTFDVARGNARDHITFGHGRHTCLGIHLARLEAEVAVRTLLERLPALRLDPDRPCRPRGHEFRKVRPLWVRWE